jgi:peptide deformylase
MKEEVEQVSRTGDTVGGVFEVVVHGVPAGLGTYANWDERLDGLLAWSVMSLQAVKAVEIGRGVTGAESFGSQVHDPIHYADKAADNSFARPTRFTRPHNNAGGIEGGISNGEDVIVRGYLKPISTLRRPLESVRFDTREATAASYERSDICVVPAAGVAAEAMVALTIANVAQQKFGGDSVLEMQRNFAGYILEIVKYPAPVLSQPGEPVTEFDNDLRKLVADMFETTYASQGIGLAAPQVGVSKRVTVIDLSMGKDPKDKLVLVNPEITFSEGKLYEEEGCLSFPDIREKIVRAARIRIRAQNEHGKWFEMDGDDLLSRCMQHEIDHLNGMLFIFRMSGLKRDLNLRKIRKMQREGTW